MELITGIHNRRVAENKLKALKWKLRQSKRQQARLEKEIFQLENKVWDLEVRLVKPSQMCRNNWTSGYYCALKKGHKGGCQGQAPPPVYRNFKRVYE